MTVFLFSTRCFWDGFQLIFVFFFIWDLITFPLLNSKSIELNWHGAIAKLRCSIKSIRVEAAKIRPGNSVLSLGNEIFKHNRYTYIRLILLRCGTSK